MMEKSEMENKIIGTLTGGLISPKITVVGCGGAGNRIVQSIYWNSSIEVETIAVNTDEEGLNRIDAHKKVLIGKNITNGRGASGSPEIGEYCAECARSIFENMLAGSDIVFIIAGMGGGTGTGAAPIIAEIAKNLGAVTFAIAISPFSFERERAEKARRGIERLQRVTQTTIVLENDRLLEIAGDLSADESLSIMDRSIAKIIESVDSKISESFLTQIENDVRELLEEVNEHEIQNTDQKSTYHEPVPLNKTEIYEECTPSPFSLDFEAGRGPN